MARFNQRPSGLIVPAAPIVSTPNPAARTGNNAPGFTRNAKGELFLLAVSNFVGMDAHYESGVARDARFNSLVQEVARTDPAWMGRFLPWLRNEANMRTASMVGAVEAAYAMVKANLPGGRQIVNSVLVRADEPGEAVGYWKATYPGQQIPKPIKRGIADAATRLYTEWSTLKYDTASHGVRFGDVLELTHASPDKPGQDVLFKHLIDRRHGRGGTPESYTGLPMIIKNMWVRSQVARGRTALLLDTESLRGAGMTWEDALSLAGTNGDKRSLWEALIPTMGYMALLRNLRNFDEAGISATHANIVKQRLADPDQVAKSRQLPMRFLSAFRAVSNVRWHEPLEHAIQASLVNIPEHKGRTLILIDTSGSMDRDFTTHGGRRVTDLEALKLWDAAAMFGLALAQRCEHADVVSYSDSDRVFPLQRGASLLVMLEAFKRGYFIGHGTETERYVRKHYRNHDLVVVLTDEQANWHGHKDISAAVPAHVPVITFNLNGYRVGHMESGTPTRLTIGGLTDQAFKLLPVLRHRAAGTWPF